MKFKKFGLVTVLVAVILAACATMPGGVSAPPLPSSIKDRSPEQQQALVKTLQDSAENGKREQMGALGLYYLYGWIVDVDLAKGNYWLHRAASLGDVESLARLTEHYARGVFGLPKDSQKAREYAAETYAEWLKSDELKRDRYRLHVSSALNTRGIINIEAGNKVDATADFCLANSIYPSPQVTHNLAADKLTCKK